MYSDKDTNSKLEIACPADDRGSIPLITANREPYGGVLVLTAMSVNRKHAGHWKFVLVNSSKKLVGNNTYAIAA